MDDVLPLEGTKFEVFVTSLEIIPAGDALEMVPSFSIVFEKASISRLSSTEKKKH